MIMIGEDKKIINPQLLSAAKRCDAQAIIAALESGADIDCSDFRGWTPLMIVIDNAKLELRPDRRACAELLIARGADVRGNSGIKPMHLAALRGSADILSLLIAHGADIDAVDIDHRTPIDRIIHARLGSPGKVWVDCMNVLVAAGLDLTVPRWKKKTLLEIAREQGWGDVHATYEKRQLKEAINKKGVLRDGESSLGI